MGQKVNPIGFRLQVNKRWSSKWFSRKGYRENLLNDMEVRNYLMGHLKQAGVAKVEIERSVDWVKVTVFVARPGVVIGKKGAEIEAVKKELTKITGAEKLVVDIREVRRVDTVSKLVADNISLQLERRVAFRRAMKKAVGNAMRQQGVGGIKIQVAGRLNGAEMSRKEWYREGRVPLHTLKSNIDYATSLAKTTFGIIGVKVWIFKTESRSGDKRKTN